MHLSCCSMVNVKKKPRSKVARFQRNLLALAKRLPAWAAKDLHSVRASNMAPRSGHTDTLILLSSLPWETHLIPLFVCVTDRQCERLEWAVHQTAHNVFVGSNRSRGYLWCLHSPTAKLLQFYELHASVFSCSIASPRLFELIVSNYMSTYS